MDLTEFMIVTLKAVKSDEPVMTKMTVKSFQLKLSAQNAPAGILHVPTTVKSENPNQEMRPTKQLGCSWFTAHKAPHSWTERSTLDKQVQIVYKL